MEKIVVFSESVENYLEQLIETLFEKEYFGFKIDAKNYVRKIIYYTENHTFENGVYETSTKYSDFGKYYIRYKANQHTFWYIFFDKKENHVLINHIFNNHDHDFPELI